MDGARRYLVYAAFLLAGLLGLSIIDGSVFSIALYSVAIIIGALMIAWAAESSEFVISEGLALAIVAWLQVFPEFMIEATISWAQDVPNMLSNFTGANRILTGVGWPLVFFTASFFFRRRSGHFLGEIKLRDEHSAEVIFFLGASLYSVVIFLRGYLTLIDSAVMIAIYLAYLYFVSRLPHLSRKKGEKLIGGIPKMILGLKKNYALLAISFMMIGGGLLIFFVSEPFYNTALVVAGSLGISQFLFIQWIAPFLSEFPEKTSAFYWASKVKQAPMALMNLISSKLTQWTVLLAMIPVVFSLSIGLPSEVPLDSMVEGTSFTVATELLLTIATSFYASVSLLRLRFGWFEASSLFGLWLVQFAWVEYRPAIVWVYFALAIVQIIFYHKEMGRAFAGFKNMFFSHVGKQEQG
jgi:cation:H+ antiporter